MWTVCWTDDNGDRWERCFSVEEVIAIVENLDNDNVLIFSPNAEDCTVAVDDLEDYIV